MMRRSKRNARPGISMLLVLVCLVVITTTVGAMLRSLALINRQSKQQSNASQAFWLADSGLQRAIFQLRQDAGYPGESWIVTDELFGAKTGLVQIQTLEDPSDAAFLTVQVVATFPRERTFAVKARRAARIANPRQALSGIQASGGIDRDANQ